MTINDYNQCVDECSDGVFRFIVKSIRDTDLAHDIVQDSFMKLWLKRKDVDPKKGKSYLYTTAYHTMIDSIRKNNKNVSMELVSEVESKTDNGYSDLKEVLEQAVEKLPEIQKSVILLRDYEGYSYKEIASITNLNESQVKVYIYRARLFLKNYIVSPEFVM